MPTSELPGFHKLSVAERLVKIKGIAGLTDEEAKSLHNSLGLDIANRMIENVIGTASLPLGIGTNFLINNRDYLVPMAIEETSVVAAASHAAKLARPAGFSASSDPPIMISQIHLTDVSNVAKAKQEIRAALPEIMDRANNRDSVLVSLGGGLRDIEIRELSIGGKPLLTVHLLIDVRDAMGANASNTMAEAIAPLLEEITGGRARLKIISNLAIYRLARARAVWTKEALEASYEGAIKGEEIVDGIIEAWQIAAADPFRRATHNKGIMNGIDALMIATGNDWRAIEAGAHAYSAIRGKPLTIYYKDEAGNLVGEIELPLAAGIVGGATKVNPQAQVCLKILGVKSAQELSQIAASVGLAQNFAALRALAVEGINRGHMKLHAANIAIQAGAAGALIDRVARRMIEERTVSQAKADEILKELQAKA
jgi:hydroxymethylglutaryl-CoA reductase